MSEKPKIIIISGTPGTGKSKLAKELSLSLNYAYLDLNKIILQEGISEGWDKKRQTREVDTNKLNKALLEHIREAKKAKKGLVIDSHLAHFLPSKEADVCIITKTDLKVLKKRLEKRGYPPAKIRENLDAEIFDVCLTEAVELGHNVVVLDTTKTHAKDLVKKLNF